MSKINHSTKTGFSFGIASAVITTLGLLVGLNSTTNSKSIIIGGILTIAVADAFSDALGIHISEESEGKHTEKEIWTSTISTFLSKFIFALTFLLPIIFLPLSLSIFIDIIWGFLLLTLFSYYLAKSQKSSPFRVIGEHLLIAIIVVLLTNFVGKYIANIF